MTRRKRFARVLGVSRPLAAIAIGLMLSPCGCGGDVDASGSGDSQDRDAAVDQFDAGCDLSASTVTEADLESYFFDNPVAAGICLPLLACGFLAPQPDDNAVFLFIRCMVNNAEDCAGRAKRLGCVQSFDGDCAQLGACVEATYADVERRCEGGRGGYVDTLTGEIQAAWSCSRILTGGDCDPDGESCVPCGPSVTPGCGTPPERCEDDDTHMDCRSGPPDVTYAHTCGSGYHCVSEYNGPTSYWARCEGEGSNHCEPMGFGCTGATLEVCTENYAPFAYDCLAYGFLGCDQGKCVW